jgi:hypothetical protein
MSRGDAAELTHQAADGAMATQARKALSHERAGRFREAWTVWEQLREAHPSRSDWNAPLAASYLRFAFDWTSDGPEGTLREAEEALVRGVSILTIDVAGHPDDVARLMLIARACEQRCVLRAFGEGWTREARDALDAGEAPPMTGDPRQVRAAGAAAIAAFDLLAQRAPTLAPLSAELARSCLRLAATLEVSGGKAQANALLVRAEAALKGPREPRMRPHLIAIEGGAGEGERTPPRRPQLRLVTTPTA